MSKPIRILISVIMLMFGFVFADCLYGFTIGGEINFIGLIIFVVIGIILSLVSILIIFGKENNEKKKDAFVIILVIFLALCAFCYMPLNRISGNNEYMEKQVEVVEIYTIKGNFSLIEPEYNVTVKDENGEVYEVQDYHSGIYYEEGDTVSVREYIGGFDMTYYTITKINPN